MFYRILAFFEHILTKRTALLVALLDAAILPGIALGRVVTALMMQFGSDCAWTKFGLLCGTCGGTRCVIRLLHGDFVEAFFFNEWVFLWILFLVLTVALLNMAFLMRLRFAKTVLKKMYSLPTLIVFLGSLVVFTVVRNIPAVIQLLT